MPISEREFAICLGYSPSGEDDGAAFDPVYFHAEHQFADTITIEDGAENALLPFTNVLLNVGDAYDAETSIFTVPATGIYQIGYQVQVINGIAELSSAPTAGTALITVVQDGSHVRHQLMRSVENAGSPVLLPVAHTSIIELTEGEEIKLNVRQLADMDFTPDFNLGGCFFWARRIA